MIARRIGELAYAVYGPRRRSAPNLAWIAYEEGLSALPHVVWIDRAIKRDGGLPALTVNDSEVALHAIKEGVGKSLLPCAIGDHEAGVMRLDGSAAVLRRELWLLVHPEMRHLARVKAVVAWLEGLAEGSRGTPPSYAPGATATRRQAERTSVCGNEADGCGHNNRGRAARVYEFAA